MAYKIVVGERLLALSGAALYRDDAPEYGECTGRISQRVVSGYWPRFMKTLGLTDVMYGISGGKFTWDGYWYSALITGSLGCTAITSAHVEAVEKAVAAYKEADPINVAGWEFGEDHPLCHGEWLAYWLRWAIDNCQYPVFVYQSLRSL